MDDVFNSFDIEFPPGEKLGVRSIFPGDRCEIALDGEVVIDGYVDSTSESDDAYLISLGASGRSKASDLVDCFAVDEPFQWNNAYLETIVESLCLPFGIEVDVVDDISETAFNAFAVRRGETVADAILRAAHRRGKHVYSVGGKLVCASTGATRTATVLKRGVNVVRSERSDDWSGRYSDYVFCAQASPSDGRWGRAAAAIQTKALDSTIKRYRPYLIDAEAQDKDEWTRLAALERNRRARNGERLTVTVDGWQTIEGYAWRPNLLVRYKNPVLGVDADLVVASATFRLGANEPKETELALGRPEAIDVRDYPSMARGDEWT
jgi:prophage tail gpP-like protein